MKKTKGVRFKLTMALGIVSMLLAWAPSLSEAQGVLPEAPGSFNRLVEEVSPSVVNISAVRIMKGGSTPFTSPFGSEDPMREFFEKFFQFPMPKEFKQRSLGSGFIIDDEGFVLTNHHVVANTEEIEVTLKDERTFKAQVIARDPKTDLALLKIDAEDALKPISLGDSDELRVGDWVVAIGSPFGLGHTVTAGIVSAKYRKIGAEIYEDFIQTDASINPGNSGGPLLDVKGDVVGINTAIFSQSGGNIGIGFAIPINMAKDLLPQLKKGEVIRGWLGVMIQGITPEIAEKLNLETDRGALVADVTDGSPADKAGIMRGDVIISFDDQEIKEMNELPMIVASTPVGEEVSVEVMRKGKHKEFDVTIGRLKDEETVAAADDEEKPKLGLAVRDITPEIAQKYQLPRTDGLLVVKVESASPASEAGMLPGDIILEVDQEPVRDLKGFKRKIGNYEKGDTILFLIQRKDSTLFVTLEVSG